MLKFTKPGEIITSDKNIENIFFKAKANVRYKYEIANDFINCPWFKAGLFFKSGPDNLDYN